MLLDRKFNEEFKNVLKIVIFSLQVGFTGDFVTDCPFKLCVSLNFGTAFLSDCTKFCSIFFSCYRIGNLMRISNMCLKLTFFHSK